MKRKSRRIRRDEALAKISEGLADIEALKDEIEEWRDGMEGTNLENTQKYEDLNECADALETGYSDIEDAVSELENIEFPGMF